MKKSKQSILLLLAFSFLATTMQSQNAIGGKLGVNFAKWTGDEDELFEDGTKRLVGGQIGLAFQVGINEMISIQPEILYLQKGIRIQASFGGGDSYKEIIKFNYLEVPVLVKLNFPLNEKLSVFATAGPSIGYAINAMYIYDDGDERIEENLEIGEDEFFVRTDLSLIFGSGLGYNLPIGQLMLEGRYLHGISNIFDENDIDVNNRGIGITMGFMLPF